MQLNQSHLLACIGERQLLIFRQQVLLGMYAEWHLMIYFSGASPKDFLLCWSI